MFGCGSNYYDPNNVTQPLEMLGLKKQSKFQSRKALAMWRLIFSVFDPCPGVEMRGTTINHVKRLTASQKVNLGFRLKLNSNTLELWFVLIQVFTSNSLHNWKSTNWPILTKGDSIIELKEKREQGRQRKRKQKRSSCPQGRPQCVKY